jgi:hypothetical protein
VQQLKKIRRKPNSAQVIVRFCLRLSILIAFAVFASVGFGRALVALLWMSTILCAVIGFMRREPFLASDLNHWDEMAAYGALCALAQASGQ